MPKNQDEPIRTVQLISRLQAQRWQAMTRRHFLKVVGGTVLGGVAITALNARAQEPTASTTAANSPASTPVSTTPASTTNSAAVDGTLIIPPLLVPQVQNGTKVFNLTLQKGLSQFLAGTTTA